MTICFGEQIRFLLLGCLLLGGGCGLKAPPVPPKTTVPPAVTDFKAELTGDMVRLTWTLPTKESAVFPGVEYCRIYKHEVPVSEAPCEGCPIPFEPVLDIRLDSPAPARMEAGRMIWEDEVKPVRRYAYMVTVHHETGGVSKESNVVQFATGE